MQAGRVNLKSFLKQPRFPKKKKLPGNCGFAASSSFYSFASLELARESGQTGLAVHTLHSSDQLINCLNASCSRIFSKSASVFANSLHKLGLRLRARFKFSMAKSIWPCSA